MEKTINHYSVEITDGTGIIKHATGFCADAFSVVAESERQFVVADLRRNCFVVIQKNKTSYATCLEVESISIYKADSCWGNRVFYSLYTEKKKKAKSIKSAIEREITRKLGFFISGINLDCIKD